MDWAEKGACRGMDQAIFFPSPGPRKAADLKPAKAICARCPVRAECLAYALSLPFPAYGVWGGTSERERARMTERPTPWSYRAKVRA